MDRILIGNLISACASGCLAASCVVNDKRRAYFFQMMESLLLTISACFFGVWSSMVTQAIGTVRNGLVMKERFTTPLMVVCTVLTVVIGVAVNNRGLVGLIPVAATVQLTLCNYYVKSLRGVKLSFLVNVILWTVYSYCILDIAYGTASAVIAVLTVISLVRLVRKEKADG
ncbi:MAG: YgjV family protein [Oscillospiraceae bacterium]|nr:YgjV family protein [Oscillospiraceae bacterium]